MSKSEWKELPDGTKPEEYAFLDGAKPEVWAWEFLRRNPEYRADWKSVAGKNDCIYDPPRRKGETDEAWEYRTLLAGGKPIKTTLERHIGAKWLLQRLYDPLQPYAQGVRFHRPMEKFPRVISFPEQFLELVDDEEMERGAGFQRVADGIAVIVFDITAPRTNQLKAANIIIRKWHKQMESAGRVIRIEGHAGKIGVWKRHLQVLDAQRANSDISYKEIGEIFWKNKPAGTKAGRVRNEGKKFSDAAYMQMKLYKKVLLFKNTRKIAKS